MRSIIVGNRKLAQHLLRHAIREGWNVVGALVPEGDLAKTQANFTTIDDIVANTECEHHTTTDINSNETAAWMDRLNPDICLCGGWSQIIDQRVLEIPDRGFLGFHSSQLPAGRGGAPVNWSLINGEESVWITLFYYDTGVDTGDIVAQGSVSVRPRDDVKTIFDRLAAKACQIVSTVRPDLETSRVEAEPQCMEEATYRPRRQPQDGLIDWNRNPGNQYDWVRGQTSPYPGAYSFYEGERVTVWRGKPVETEVTSVEPGEVISVVDGAGINVRSGDGAFRLERVQREDRPARWADDYAETVGITPGDCFGRRFAPNNWLYTGIRGPDIATSFQTNLTTEETGAVRLVAYSGSQRSLTVKGILDGNSILEETQEITDEYNTECEYGPLGPGTHTLKLKYISEGEDVDTRYLKIYVHE